MIDAHGLGRRACGLDTPGVGLRLGGCGGVSRLRLGRRQTFLLQVQRVPAKAEAAQQNGPCP
ncbi:hypothetical protein [Brevundimonas intermedia]|uniref:hypothetical protein n=1 Tax=Brevundimonas intermedia TaxID=74315 RepID=UPI00320ACDE2